MTPAALGVVLIDEHSLMYGQKASETLSLLTAVANRIDFFRLTGKSKDDLLPEHFLLSITGG